MNRLVIAGLMLAILLAACGRGEAEIDSGPTQPDETPSDPSTSTTRPEDDDDDQTDDVETDDGTNNATSTSSVPEAAGATTVVIDENSENADAYIELAASGLVLSLVEQGCTDDEVESEIDDGVERIDAIVAAVKSCAAPKVIDDFASLLISAGGEPLPRTEAACVASRLRSDDDYLPFWAALFAEESFDFLVVELDVQNLYLGLFSECVSVGRALSTQLGDGLSSSTIGCIDALYSDREFVRVTIEADLSGDAEDLTRIDNQISGCLSTSEREALGLN